MVCRYVVSPKSMVNTSRLRLTCAPHRWARRLIWICLAVELGLVFLDYHVNWGLWTQSAPIKRLFDITLEDGLPAWFAETQTLFVALIAWAIYAVAGRSKADRVRRVGWCFSAVLFTYMAVDDGTRLHERIGTAYRQASQSTDAPTVPVGDDEEPVPSPVSAGGFPSYAWQVIFVPAFALAGLALLVFLWRELRDPGAFRWVLAGLACWVVAVGLDFIEGLHQTHPWNVQVWIINRVDLIDFTARHFDSLPFDTVRHFFKSLEELLEMVGMTFFGAVFLRHLGTVAGGVMIQVAHSQPNQKN